MADINPFNNLGASPLEGQNNPFNNLEGKNMVGVALPPIPETHFAKYEKAKSAAAVSTAEAEKANSFGSLALKTLSPTNIGNAAGDVVGKEIFNMAKAVVTKPIETARHAALSLFDGMTLGALNYTLKKTLIDEALKSGISNEEATRIAENILVPQDPGVRRVGQVVEFASMLVPYKATEKALTVGLRYAAPEFVAKYAKVADMLKTWGVFAGTGQVSESFVPPEQRDRVKRLAVDTALAGVFSGGGYVYRKISHTPFKSPFEITPTTNTNSLVPQSVTVSQDSLTEGATARIAELAKKSFLKEGERTELTFLRKNLTNPDELYRYNAAPPKADVPVPEAKTVATVETGPVDAKTGKATGEKINVATNDLPALQDYIKGSNNIDYKIAENLGKDAKGRDIQARHEFNPTTGLHTIYTTEATTASNLAHELGHYFDTKLTASTEKLSSMIPAFEKNRGAIEDTLGSFATERLGGNATAEQISKEIATTVQAINREVDVLSSIRRGELIKSPSEKFADAVSEILIKNDARQQAPVLTDLLRHSERMDTAKLFGESVAKETKAGASFSATPAKVPDNIMNVNGKTLELSGKALDEYKAAKAKFDSRMKLYEGKNDAGAQASKKAIGMEFSAEKRRISGELTQTEINNAVKTERSNYIGKQVEVDINGKKVQATIESKPSYGNVKVKLEDGTVLSIKNSQISADVRRVEDIIAKVTGREGVKPFDATAKAVAVANEAPVADKAYKSIVDNGGVTIDTKGNVPDKGFAYAPEKGTEFSVAKEDFTPAHLDEFMAKNEQLLAKEGNFIGGWEDGGKIYLDVSRVGEASAATLEEAQKASQLGVFDLSTLGTEKNGNITLGEMKNGVYTKTDEAINVYDKYAGQDSGASKVGSNAGSTEVPGGGGQGQGGATGGEKVAPDLNRQPTGKKPDTTAIRAELVSTNADVETFINQKVLSKMTGEERISRSNADILKQAYDSNLTQDSFDKILKERVGNLPADVIKAKQIMADGAMALQGKLAGRNIAELSGQELKDTMSEYNRLVQTFEVFAGVRTEISNTFRSLGLGVAPGENDVLVNALETIQKAIGGETDPFKIMKKVIAVEQKGNIAKYFEIRYAAMLSGPKTQARNLVGNTANLATQVTARAFTKNGRREFMPMVRAIIDGNKEAYAKAAAVMKGDTAFLSKFVDQPMPADKMFTGKLAFLNKIEYVGRSLNAGDMYFKSLAGDAEIAAQRVGDFTYGLKSPELQKAVNEAVGNNFANKVTYRGAYEKTTVQELAKLVSSAKQVDNAFVKFLANQFTPFVKTIAKITDARIDLMPILNIPRTFESLGARKLWEDTSGKILKDAGLFNKLMEENIVNGMSSQEARAVAQSEVGRVQEIVIGRLKDQQRGRFYMGLSVLAAGAPLAVTGRITGSGPSNKRERDTLISTGWRPNSIIMPNGVALPYLNLGPVSGALSLLGNISDAYKYNDTGSSTENLMNAAFGYLRSEKDQSFLKGISDIYDGAFGYTTKTQMAYNMVISGIPIPAAWEQTKDIVFPERYDPKGFSETIKDKLGITGDFFGTGATTPLQPRLDAFGNQVKADLIYGLTPPILNSKTDDPVYNFMLKENIGIAKPTMGNKIQGRNGQSRPMTGAEYTTFVKESGQKMYDALQPRVASGYFDKFKTKEEKQKAVDSIIKDIRAREKAKIRF